MTYNISYLHINITIMSIQVKRKASIKDEDASVVYNDS